MQHYPLSLQMLMQRLCHLEVQRRHDLIERLNNGNLQPRVVQIFCHLEPNKTAADNDCIFCFALFYKAANVVSIWYCPQCRYPGGINSWYGGDKRCGAGG